MQWKDESFSFLLMLIVYLYRIELNSLWNDKYGSVCKESIMMFFSEVQFVSNE